MFFVCLIHEMKDEQFQNETNQNCLAAQDIDTLRNFFLYDNQIKRERAEQ